MQGGADNVGAGRQEGRKVSVECGVAPMASVRGGRRGESHRWDARAAPRRRVKRGRRGESHRWRGKSKVLGKFLAREKI